MKALVTLGIMAIGFLIAFIDVHFKLKKEKKKEEKEQRKEKNHK